MAVTAKLYGNGLFKAAFNKEIDLLDDDIRVTLHTSAYTPDQDVHDYADDLSNEVTGTGYTAGGQALANDTLTYTAGTNVLKYDADDLSWPNSTITARTAVIKDNTPSTAATKPLIGYQQSDADIISTGGTFSIAWHADGIFTITIG
jgi:hypothetical protein